MVSRRGAGPALQKSPGLGGIPPWDFPESGRISAQQKITGRKERQFVPPE